MGPNWKSIYVAMAEETKETRGEWRRGGMAVVLLWFTTSIQYLLFVMQH